MRFARQLAGRASQTHLTPADIDRELAAWLEPSPALIGVCRQAFEFCEQKRSAEETPRRRWHVFERALVMRFEHMLNSDGDTAPMVSRRMLLGLTFAVTRMIGADAFSRYTRQANDIAAQLGGPAALEVPAEAFAAPRMRLLVNRCLMELARRFDDVPRQLTDILTLINGRLAAPQLGAWDQDWTASRRVLLLVLEALYADLRDELERYDAPELQRRYGPDADERLSGFLPALDQAMRLADRPWLLKPIRQA